jgi:large subunit ribosomal protein L6e
MAPKKAKTPHSARNYVLGGSGVYRFSASRVYKKHGIYKLKNKAKKPAAEAVKKFITKQIGGEKNGGTRKVYTHRRPRSYPTQARPQKLPTRKNAFKDHKHSIRASITPGTVLILLAGRHKGKRVVFLKQLGSGLLLVTGQFHLNGCPLRRINQNYVIATKTNLDVSAVKLPENVNDAYFARKDLRKPKHAEGEIFDQKKETYSVDEQRKTDQVAVDKAILEAIRKHADKKLIFGYLGSMFALKSKQFPHKMVF